MTAKHTEEKYRDFFEQKLFSPEYHTFIREIDPFLSQGINEYAILLVVLDLEKSPYSGTNFGHFFNLNEKDWSPKKPEEVLPKDTEYGKSGNKTFYLGVLESFCEMMLYCRLENNQKALYNIFGAVVASE